MKQSSHAKFFSQLTVSKIIILLVVLGFAAYCNAILHPFVHDDIVFIKNNPHIADLSNPSALFLQTTRLGDFAASNSYYRPLLELLYRLQYHVFEFKAPLYHLFNIVVHIINAFLVYSLINFLIKRKGMSLIVAAIFLVHPVQSESVASIAGVSNLLYTLFCLVSFHLYLKSSSSKSKKPQYILSLLFFLLALLTKEQAIILPALILLCEILFPSLTGHDRKEKVAKVGGLFIVALFYLLFRKTISETSIFESLFLYKGELWLRVQAIPKIILTHLRIFFDFRDLHYYRSINILDPAGPSAIVFVMILIGGIFLTSRVPKDNRSILIFGAGWFFITLLPVLNIFPLIIEYSLVSVAEHFMYMPLIGFVLFLSILVDYYWKQKREQKNKIAAVAMALIVMALSLRTVLQNRYWRAEIPLFERTIRFEKRIARVHILMARAYYFDRQYNDAIDSYKTALKIMKDYVDKAKVEVARKFYLGYVKEIHFDLAHCYEAKRDYGKAVSQYKEAIKIDPRDGKIHNNLGTVYLAMGKEDAAAAHFSEAIRLNPNDTMALNNLAICLINQNKIEEAEELLERAARIDRSSHTAQQNLNQLNQNHKFPRE